MKRLVVGGLAALGLVGGTASVVYNHSGDATVKVTKNGVTRSVEIKGSSGGPKYSCPEDVIEEKVTPLVKVAGRIKLTLHEVESELKTLQAQYPSGRAPDPVVTRYNGLLSRAKALNKAFNTSIEKHNAVLVRDCESE